MRFSALLCAAAVGVVGVSSAADPPGIAVAESEPRSSAPAGVINCAEGRFVPLIVAPGKPALLLGNELDYLTLYPLGPNEAIHGIRYDEPAGAKTKRYVPSKGTNWYAVANALPEGTKTVNVTLTTVVNGAGATDAPTVAGKLVLTLTASLPPPGPPTTLTLTASPASGAAPLKVQFTATGDVAGGTLDFNDGSIANSMPVVVHTYAAAGTYTAKLIVGEKTATAVVTVTSTPVPPVVTSFRVIYVTESATALTKTQNAIINAAANVAYLNSKVTKTNNWPDWRSYDPQTGGEKDYPGLAAMWAAAKPAITTVPCVVIQVNNDIKIEPFPATAADALTLLKKYGGN